MWVAIFQTTLQPMAVILSYHHSSVVLQIHHISATRSLISFPGLELGMLHMKRADFLVIVMMINLFGAKFTL